MMCNLLDNDYVCHRLDQTTTQTDAQKQCDISSLCVLRPGPIVTVLSLQFWLKTHSPSALWFRYAVMSGICDLWNCGIRIHCVLRQSTQLSCPLDVWFWYGWLPCFLVFTCISFVLCTHKLHCCYEHCGVVAHMDCCARMYTHFSEYILHAFLSSLCVYLRVAFVCVLNQKFVTHLVSVWVDMSVSQIWIWSSKFRSFRLLRGGVSKRAINYA